MKEGRKGYMKEGRKEGRKGKEKGTFLLPTSFASSLSPAGDLNCLDRWMDGWMDGRRKGG